MKKLYRKNEHFTMDGETQGVMNGRSESDMLARLILVFGIFALGFGVLVVRLVNLSLVDQGAVRMAHGVRIDKVQARPDIFDRNGEMMATDISVASLFADARKIIDPDEAADEIGAIFPNLNTRVLRRKFSSRKAFVWIKREVTPRQKAAIYHLGIPGLGFKKETRRVYPKGRAAAHIIGHVDIDNRGTAGIEKYIEKGLKHRAVDKVTGKPEPIYLSVDLRIQHALTDELSRAKEAHKALAVAGIVLDVQSGEVVAMASLPDYDPNFPKLALEQKRLNRLTAGVYELGSTFKAFTAAMVLDSGRANMSTRYDARKPIRVSRFLIRDYHGKRRFLSVPEVFIYSSNIGAAKMAIDVGVKAHRAFLKKLGLLDRLVTELPENRRPMFPKKWQPVHSMTISYGHGLSVAPLQMASAGAALVNGGRLVHPTFLRRSAVAAFMDSKQVIKPKTSRMMREMMRLNTVKGTAKKANVAGYRVGGKTGTSEKVFNGRYDRNVLLTSFLGVFPTDAPEYIVFVMFDEPKRSKATHGYATAGWNAAPTTGRIIKRIAPMLGILPRGEQLNPFGEPVLVSY